MLINSYKNRNFARFRTKTKFFLFCLDIRTEIKIYDLINSTSKRTRLQQRTMDSFINVPF